MGALWVVLGREVSGKGVVEGGEGRLKAQGVRGRGEIAQAEDVSTVGLAPASVQLSAHFGGAGEQGTLASPVEVSGRRREREAEDPIQLLFSQHLIQKV